MHISLTLGLSPAGRQFQAFPFPRRLMSPIIHRSTPPPPGWRCALYRPPYPISELTAVPSITAAARRGATLHRVGHTLCMCVWPEILRYTVCLPLFQDALLPASPVVLPSTSPCLPPGHPPAVYLVRNTMESKPLESTPMDSNPYPSHSLT